jgi:hypothetical protein
MTSPLRRLCEPTTVRPQCLQASVWPPSSIVYPVSLFSFMQTSPALTHLPTPSPHFLNPPISNLQPPPPHPILCTTAMTKHTPRAEIDRQAPSRDGHLRKGLHPCPTPPPSPLPLPSPSPNFSILAISTNQRCRPRRERENCASVEREAGPGPETGAQRARWAAVESEELEAEDGRKMRRMVGPEGGGKKAKR